MKFSHPRQTELPAPGASYPRIAALGEDLVSGAPEERLSWMFRVVVNGTLATPRPD
ncbi:hypothetical protein [Kitasatospora sp. NPDC087314]|uniref:hypothetical protein n=1 Tax=Kitasatospora sp. NPDC087314 TaxID=3364068 RepID=UPI00382D18E6